MSDSKNFYVRNARETDIPGIIKLCEQVYPESPAWTEGQLRSHQTVFPEGQLVAAYEGTEEIIGYASSLIVFWDDYEWNTPWRDFTDSGMFTNHDPEKGRTLYGAEVMVSPNLQGMGVGKEIYAAREAIAKHLGLLRIRAGARLRGYHQYAPELTADEYVQKVVDREIFDPTLSFQLNRDFYVLKTVSGYLRHDPESLGYAAIIEWINHEIAKPEDFIFLKKSPFYRP